MHDSAVSATMIDLPLPDEKPAKLRGSKAGKRLKDASGNGFITRYGKRNLWLWLMGRYRDRTCLIENRHFQHPPASGRLAQVPSTRSDLSYHYMI
jgi:hypothetical protein